MSKRFAVVLIVCIIMSLFSTGCLNSENKTENTEKVESVNQEIFNWRLASAWGDGTILIDMDKHFADLVGKMSNGRLNIKVHGVNTLMPVQEVLDGVSKGTVEMGGECPIYWVGKNTAFDLIGTSVNSFTTMDYLLWMREAGGLALYDELYSKYNIKYFPHVIAGVESGIRSTKPVNKLDDLKGMKIRMPGLLSSKVLQDLGATPTNISTTELYEALQKGVIDGTEYSSPVNDDLMKIQEVTKYWLTPGWHQTSTVYGVAINKDKWNELPEDLKAIVDAAARATMIHFMALYNYQDAVATQNIMKAGVIETKLTNQDLEKIEQLRNKHMADFAAANPDYAKVLKSQQDYLKTYAPYRDKLGEFAFGRNWSSYLEIK